MSLSYFTLLYLKNFSHTKILYNTSYTAYFFILLRWIFFFILFRWILFIFGSFLCGRRNIILSDFYRCVSWPKNGAERFSRATEETKHRRHDARYNTHPPAERLASTIHNFDTFSVKTLAQIVNRYITSHRVQRA